MGVEQGRTFTAEQAAQKTGSLQCVKCNISSLAGIQFFTGITELFCGGNPLNSLDVSTNVALTSLVCPSCSLNALDVSQNNELTFFAMLK